MPEPNQLTDPDISRIADAMYKKLKKPEVLTVTYSYFNTSRVKGWLKLQAGLELRCHIADVDLQQAYDELGTRRGVVGSGVATKNIVYTFREEPVSKYTLTEQAP